MAAKKQPQESSHNCSLSEADSVSECTLAGCPPGAHSRHTATGFTSRRSYAACNRTFPIKTKVRIKQNSCKNQATKTQTCRVQSPHGSKKTSLFTGNLLHPFTPSLYIPSKAKPANANNDYALIKAKPANATNGHALIISQESYLVQHLFRIKNVRFLPCCKCKSESAIAFSVIYSHISVISISQILVPVPSLFLLTTMQFANIGQTDGSSIASRFFFHNLCRRSIVKKFCDDLRIQ